MRICIFIAGLVTLAPALAIGAEMPARKAGLWQMTMVFDGAGMPHQVVKQCIDAATDKEMNSLGGRMGAESCSQPAIQRAGDSIIIDSECKMGGHTTRSHAVATGDFNSAYTVKVDSKQDGPPAPGMPAAMSMTINAKWLGPCTAGQKPGDMIMSNGMTINIHNMPSMGGMPRR